MLYDLNMSDKIQIISITVSTMVAIISICIAIATLKQTNRITEEANRPYIAIYLEVIQVTSTFSSYLVMKNFGNTGAMINSVTYEPEFKGKYNNVPFSKLKNHFVSPNQSLTTAIDFEKPYKPITFTVNYSQGKRTYIDMFTINPEAISNLVFSKTTPGNSSNLEKIIAHSAQEIIRTNL